MLSMRVKIMAMTALHNKVMSLTAFAVKEANIGKVINLISSDFS